MLLDRLRADCDYFLGAGGRSEKHLWAGSVYAQVKKMRELYDALPEKPEWLTAEAIDRYAAQMAAPYQVAAYEWLIHSWDYGVELHNLIGKDVEYCIPEIERRVREALLQDDRITAVQNFEFTVNKKKVLTTFTVVSIFGEINAELGVEI